MSFNIYTCKSAIWISSVGDGKAKFNNHVKFLKVSMSSFHSSVINSLSD